MKKPTSTAIALFAVMLTLAACTAEADEHPDNMGAPSNAAGRETVDTSSPPNAAPSSRPSATAPAPLASMDLNDHGNLSEKVGQPALFAGGEEKEFAAMEVNEIHTDFQCTSASASPNINGQYVAISISVSTFAELSDSGWPYLAMSARDFTAWDADGERVPDPIGNSAGCVEQSALLPSPLQPGDGGEGLVLLDVPAGGGSAAFVIGGFEGSYGWEWAW